MVSSIGNSTLYGPQIRGGVAFLTVVLRLLKFVRTLTKFALRLGGGKKQVVYRESLKQRVFGFFEEVPGPTQGGPRGFFQGKKILFERLPIYY